LVVETPLKARIVPADRPAAVKVKVALGGVPTSAAVANF
jgi:hypothetical protein